jgi:hypothetical protein
MLKFNDCDFSILLKRVNERFNYNFISIEVTDTTSSHPINYNKPNLYEKFITVTFMDGDGDGMAIMTSFSVNSLHFSRRYWNKSRLYKHFIESVVFVGEMENGFYDFINTKKINMWKERK